MHQPQIIQHLFQVSSLEDVSRERLEAFVETYPSFGIGHYLLSCKLQAEGSDRFLPETQRTCLYFSNPLWLQWLLQNSDGMPVTQPVAFERAEETPIAVEETPAVVEEVYVTPEVEAMPVSAPVEEVHEVPVENVVTMAEEAFVAPAGDDLAESLTAEGSSAADELLRSIEEARGLRESLQQPDEDHSPEVAIAGESLPVETEPEHVAEVVPEPVQEIAAPQEEPVAAVEEQAAVAEEPVATVEEPIRDEEAPFVLDEEVVQEQHAAVAETPVVEEVPAVAEAAVVEAPAEETPKPAPTVTQDFLFEPYHTIDYFASQGIKLTLDENPNDKLGKQLKSFTEWLKTMRRLPQKDREVVPDRVAEEAVQSSAADSIKGKDVLTETMAEVLAKQGMREKARAVYEKLSLLNPDKRAYFAAKIEQLNIP